MPLPPSPDRNSPAPASAGIDAILTAADQRLPALGGGARRVGTCHADESEQANDHVVTHIRKNAGDCLMPLFLRFILVLLLGSGCALADGGTVNWIRSDTDAFARAARDNRFVLLYLEAVWCHWCHVMDQQTYTDPAVKAVIEDHYVPLRIDQDARPDLANRYRDYGWPATIVFDPAGREIVKRQGYVAPERFVRLLQAIVADPSPEAADNADAGGPLPSRLAQDTRKALQARHRSAHDDKAGGLDINQKFLDRDSVEWQMVNALAGIAEEGRRAQQTLDAARALIDPVWGGVYQYSTHHDWQHPHYEKLATVQAEYLRIYTLAYAQWRRESDRNAALAIRRYIDRFLKSKDGGYYVSQDADLTAGTHAEDYFAGDDATRRARGIPRIDTHRYAQQTGQIAEALATWAEYTGDTQALDDAVAAVEWALRERAHGKGGFRHDEKDTAGPYLADTLAMGRAFLALYRATADQRWYMHAVAAADYIQAHFRDKRGGYAAAVSRGPIPPLPQIDENLSVTRFTNLLSRYSGSATHKDMAAHALSWLAQPSIALERLTEAGILLADQEVHSDPLHLTVIGPHADGRSKVLFSTTQQLPGWYKRVEWWDRDGKRLPNADVDYPRPKRPAAFICTDRRCSLPIFTAEGIGEFLATENPMHRKERPDTD
ncbi:DUF255 domain-containing protein [Tahibacter amnicola]|uniref:DUF255 domain-containing protein n=1 Tax=Tahibacter amnicola TaxID=2976241 RepID=A0ABY6BNN2_9GAMM|nr:DUF255 domain-containing protein [Tahibacter amnicola]UXI70000.1 DUF255 domain-containing protein [Tahibacter amnicola]